MGVWREESHLASCIAAIGAVCVRLDEFPNGKAVRGFAGGDGHVLAHERASLRLENGAGFEKCLNPVSAIFAAHTGIFESSPRGLWIIRQGVDHHAP